MKIFEQIAVNDHEIQEQRKRQKRCKPDGEKYLEIEREIARNPRVRMLLFSRRFGQPAATMAGILACAGESCAVIDVDLQDPPEVLPEFIAKWREGYEVVYAVREEREEEEDRERDRADQALLAEVGEPLGEVAQGVVLDQDPGETRNLAAGQPGRTAELSKLIRERFAGVRNRGAKQGISDEMKEELKSLGYVAH